MCDQSTCPGLHYAHPKLSNDIPDTANSCLSSLSPSSSLSFRSLTDDEDDCNTPGVDLIEGALTGIISLRLQLIFLRKRCQQLEHDLLVQKQCPVNQVEVLVGCVEQERAEYHQSLQTTVLCQKKLIFELQRQLRIIRTKLKALSKCGTSINHCRCGDHCNSRDSTSKVECSQQDFNHLETRRSLLEGASGLHHLNAEREPESQTSMRFMRDNISSQHKEFCVQVQDCDSISSPDNEAMLGGSSFKMKHANCQDGGSLKRHLRATIDMCIRLSQSLNDHCARCHETGSDKMTELCDNLCLDDDDLDVEIPETKKVARLVEKLNKMELSNEDLRRYALRRDQYIDVLAQRCSDLELSRRRLLSGDCLSAAESQQKLDRLLSDERCKTERIEEAKKQVEDENRFLKSTLLRLGSERRDLDTRLSQALSRLRSSESRRIESTERIQFLERQLSAYADDFTAEHRDRLLAQGRVAQLRVQLANALRQLESNQPRAAVPTGFRDNCDHSSWIRLDRTRSCNDPDDASTPSLIGRTADNAAHIKDVL